MIILKKREISRLFLCFLKVSRIYSFAGSVSLSTGYTIIEIDLNNEIFLVLKDVSGLVIKEKHLMFDIVLLKGSEKDVFREYSTLRRDSFSASPGERAASWSCRTEKKTIHLLILKKS